MSKRLEYKWLVGLIFVVALFMDLLDMTVTNVAIPTLSEEFTASTTTIEWVITGYLLSLATFIPVSGWLGDRFGTKRMFMLALGLFTTASLLCGLAWNVESLIAFRVFQGVGGGMLTPVGTTMLFRAFPPSERAAASALLAIPITVAPALGPVLGGYLVEYQDWRWIFFVNIPIGALGLLLSATFLREEKVAGTGKLDVAGFALASTGLVSLVYALAEAGHRGFGDSMVLSFGAAGLALLTAFTLVELRTREPMIDVRLLTDKLFGAANFVQVVGNAGQFGAFFLLPIFLQAQKGLSPLESGLVMFPMAVGVAVMAQPAARIYPIVGPRKMMIAGFLVNMLVTAWLGFISYDTSNWWLGLNMFLRGMGFGLLIVPLQAATFATIRPQDTGRASSVFNVGRQVAASLGIAVLATALTNRLDHHAAQLGNPAFRGPALAAFHDAFFFAAALAVLGVIAAFVIDDEQAAQAIETEGAFAVETAA
jgi:EmrB/QacA subfamily drug resistance transporter